jgi:hypothetical protein
MAKNGFLEEAMQWGNRLTLWIGLITRFTILTIGVGLETVGFDPGKSPLANPPRLLFRRKILPVLLINQ